VCLRLVRIQQMVFGTIEKRKKLREIYYAARVHLIKHLVGLSDQSKRKTKKTVIRLPQGVYTT